MELQIIQMFYGLSPDLCNFQQDPQRKLLQACPVVHDMLTILSARKIAGTHISYGAGQHF